MHGNRWCLVRWDPSAGLGLSGLDESSSKIWKRVSHSLCVTIMGVTVKTIWALVGWALKTLSMAFRYYCAKFGSYDANLLN